MLELLKEQIGIQKFGRFFMVKFKKIVAAAVAAASISAMSVTASAATVLQTPVDWEARYVQGAPSSVSATRFYTVYTYGNGHDITCTSFSGNYNRTVEVRAQYKTKQGSKVEAVDANVVELHAETYSAITFKNPEYIYGDTITFSFGASGYPSCEARGVIDQHK